MIIISAPLGQNEGETRRNGNDMEEGIYCIA